ncbi:MAG TPA: hypothetical protein VF443_07815 [Nitrospira sp.]
MAFDWTQYQPETGGITGQTSVDPSQLQIPNGGFGTSGTSTATNGTTYNYNLNPLNGPISYSPVAQDSRTISLQNPAPTSPMQPGNAPPTGTPTTAPSGGGTQSAQAYFQSLFPPGSNLTPQMLIDKEADLKAHGITLIRNAAGQPGKIQLADGSAFDVIQGAGDGTNKAQWNQIAGAGGAPTGGGSNGYGSLNGMNAGYMTAPFVPPSYEDALKDPGAQYAINEAFRTMQNGAAARGTLLNGRTLQAENQAVMANANTLYGDIYNRAYQTQTRNQDAPFQKYTTLASLGKPS